MGWDLMFPAGLAAIAGVGVLRWSWSHKTRVTALNMLGWGLLLLAAALGGVQAGAWGVAVASLIAMLAAALLLCWAALTSPQGRNKATRRRANVLPDGGEPLRLGGRALTFAVVVIGGLAAAIALGVALRVAALAIGWAEADAIAFALVSVPVTWGILATMLLMQHPRRAQYLTLLAAGVPLLPALLAGS